MDRAGILSNFLKRTSAPTVKRWKLLRLIAFGWVVAYRESHSNCYYIGMVRPGPMLSRVTTAKFHQFMLFLLLMFGLRYIAGIPTSRPISFIQTVPNGLMYPVRT